MVITKIDEARKSKNYASLSTTLSELEKFKELKDHLPFSKGKHPSEL